MCTSGLPALEKPNSLLEVKPGPKGISPEILIQLGKTQLIPTQQKPKEHAKKIRTDLTCDLRSDRVRGASE